MERYQQDSFLVWLPGLEKTKSSLSEFLDKYSTRRMEIPQKRTKEEMSTNAFVVWEPISFLDKIKGLV
jgi:hypothetical protein